MKDFISYLYSLRLSSMVITSITFGCLYLLNRKIDKERKRYYENIRKEKMIDVLNVNHLLGFGNLDEICDKHETKIQNCRNLNCNYGKLSFLLNLIESSRRSLDVCIFIITAKEFGESILKAYRRGVKIRIITDLDHSYSPQSYVNKFLEEDIPLRRKMSKFLMHHKFIIVDEEIVINGSMNFTPTGAYCNIENVMVTSQPVLVRQFRKCFNDFWNQLDFKKY